MSAATAIQGQADRIAKGRQTMQAAFSTGTDFWTRVDAAADMTYENIVKGSDITAMDTALAAASVWSTQELKIWFTRHNTYFQTGLSLTAPFVDSYFASVGWRVPYEFSQSWYEATGTRIGSKYVFAKGTSVADTSDPSAGGMHRLMTGVDVAAAETYTTGDGTLTNCESPCVVVSMSIAPGGTGHSMTLTLSDGATTRDVLYTPATYAFGQVYVGAATISPCTVADVTITLATTAQFAAGCDVLLATATYYNPEVVTIGTVTATTLIFTTAVKNSRAANDLCIPLCKAAARKAGTLDTGKSITAYAWPDRTIAL